MNKVVTDWTETKFDELHFADCLLWTLKTFVVLSWHVVLLFMTHRHDTTCIMKNQKLPSTNDKLGPMPHHDITIQHFGPSVFIRNKVQRDLADMNWLPYVASQVTDGMARTFSIIHRTSLISCERCHKKVSWISSSWASHLRNTGCHRGTVPHNFTFSST